MSLQNLRYERGYRTFKQDKIGMISLTRCKYISSAVYMRCRNMEFYLLFWSCELAVN